ncbi:hypothetical protein KG088_15780 [Halomonas sp. TRM85114]|uniref:hypothetical protein n=1 Tax=Halomonas jincaotanensis TaxID=2810616 RepID=UPI001BD1EEB5|nr:hypothetical protein [Halomonas jincaotanensis]MBS9405084.1 hypothetical protein [Halomonas jincaotanensis]
MNVLHVTDEANRDACLARLCAEHYGQAAGLAPLVTFAGTRRVLFVEQAARLLALVNAEGTPLALALLVLDETGEGMTLTLACSLTENDEPRCRLIGELALKAPLRVSAADAEQEAFYRRCGITRWLTGGDGERIGVASRHPAERLDELTATLRVDDDVVLRHFKHDPRMFENEKRRFVDGLEAFPDTLT